MKINNIALSLTLSLVTFTPCSAADLLVPAYFYPSSDPQLSYWDDMTNALIHAQEQHQNLNITAIMNPNNGPSSAANSDYAKAIQDFRAAGGKVVGYVYTCYGVSDCFVKNETRSVQDVLADVNTYTQFYPGEIDGIFLDELSSQNAALGFYKDVTDPIKAAHPQWEIIGNAGIFPVDPNYFDLLTTVVTHEEASAPSGSSPQNNTDWLTAADPGRQARLFYNVSSEQAMFNLLEQSAKAKYVYFTDDDVVNSLGINDNNPWDRLPSYWNAEALAVANISAVPIPSAAFLYFSGMLGLIFPRKLLPQLGKPVFCRKRFVQNTRSFAPS